MSKNKFEFGELNPNIVARSGHQLDPARFSAYHVQQKLIEGYLHPTGFKTLQGPLRGIVLRIENPSSISSFGEYLGSTEVVKPPLVRVKVRIPELHPFPEPQVYGKEGDDSIISLYPTFVAVSADIPTPAEGEIVYVDYGDRDNLEDPRFYGSVFNNPVFGGTNQTVETPIKKASLFNKVSNSLGSLKDFLSPPSQNKDPIPQVPNEPIPDCKEVPSQDQLFQTDTSECLKQDTIAGEYDLFVKGEKIGTANMVVWTNNDSRRTKKLVREDVIHTLEQMRIDMLAQTGIELRLNSGFRSVDTQQCMYDKYLKCKQEWVKSGRKGLPPSAIGDPQLAGPNSHVTGRAADFQTNVGEKNLIEAKQTKSKAEIIAEAKEGNYTKTWQWLINNSQKYGWVWTGFGFNEPWHFEFNEQLARSSGIYPKI